LALPLDHKACRPAPEQAPIASVKPAKLTSRAAPQIYDRRKSGGRPGADHETQVSRVRADRLFGENTMTAIAAKTMGLAPFGMRSRPEQFHGTGS